MVQAKQPATAPWRVQQQLQQQQRQQQLQSPAAAEQALGQAQGEEGKARSRAVNSYLPGGGWPRWCFCVRACSGTRCSRRCSIGKQLQRGIERRPRTANRRPRPPLDVVQGRIRYLVLPAARPAAPNPVLARSFHPRHCCFCRSCLSNPVLASWFCLLRWLVAFLMRRPDLSRFGGISKRQTAAEIRL